MPLIHYQCECSCSTSKFFRHPKDVPLEVICKECGKNAKKKLKGPSSKSIVVVDNGVQARATEVDLEMVEDIEARSTKDFKEKK
jgi:hypothetical protein